jgi:hypothetical protein
MSVLMLASAVANNSGVDAQPARRSICDSPACTCTSPDRVYCTAELPYHDKAYFEWGYNANSARYRLIEQRELEFSCAATRSLTGFDCTTVSLSTRVTFNGCRACDTLNLFECQRHEHTCPVLASVYTTTVRFSFRRRRRAIIGRLSSTFMHLQPPPDNTVMKPAVVLPVEGSGGASLVSTTVQPLTTQASRG